eukprot:m.169954 g.169954  ORF g.169954 m.169954 type:complete len:226 (-) comp17818_c0_seq7:160-837(-)
MALSVWRMATVPGGWGFTVFWHPEYETIVELCHGSIGWYRFQEDKGTKPRICWSRGDLGNQDFGSHGLLDAVKRETVPAGSSTTVSTTVSSRVHNRVNNCMPCQRPCQPMSHCAVVVLGPDAEVKVSVDAGKWKIVESDDGYVHCTNEPKATLKLTSAGFVYVAENAPTALVVFQGQLLERVPVEQLDDYLVGKIKGRVFARIKGLVLAQSPRGEIACHFVVPSV